MSATNLLRQIHTPEIAIGQTTVLAFKRHGDIGNLDSDASNSKRLRAARGRLMQEEEKPQLVMTRGEGEPMAYHCSLCGQLFLLPDDRSPRDAAAELLEAFREHVREEHAERAERD